MDPNRVTSGGGWQTPQAMNLRGTEPGSRFPAPPNTAMPALGFRTFRPVKLCAP